MTVYLLKSSSSDATYFLIKKEIWTLTFRLIFLLEHCVIEDETLDRFELIEKFEQGIFMLSFIRVYFRAS